ncbi:hypothetical protein ACFV0T_04595 [Streptomyces sp. NPDC059582]|uniref:hypothetical protein n=1 Tax=Streptomyces sp. NPDC059582 TaxID=3346875 RepID=UPI00367B63C8
MGEDPNAGALAADLPSAGHELLVLHRGQGDRLVAAERDAARLRLSAHSGPPPLALVVSG